MWSGKAMIAGAVLVTAGCATIPERRMTQSSGPAARPAAAIELAGCLLAGAAPGTFVLADTGDANVGAVDVMSTRIGLTGYLGRRVIVRGREYGAPRRSIHDGARLFRVQELAVESSACSK